MVVRGEKITVDEGYGAEFPQSEDLYHTAKEVIPRGVAHDARCLELLPIYTSRASGPKKWDVDGNEFIHY